MQLNTATDHPAHSLQSCFPNSSAAILWQWCANAWNFVARKLFYFKAELHHPIFQFIEVFIHERQKGQDEQ